MTHTEEWLGLDYWVYDCFSFRNPTQSSGWDKAISFRNIKHGEYLAHFFIDEGGSLDIDKMCQTLNELVVGGCVDPFKELYERTKIDIGPRPEVDEVWKDQLAIYLGFNPHEWEIYLGLELSYEDLDNLNYREHDEDDEDDTEFDEWEDEGMVFRTYY